MFIRSVVSIMLVCAMFLGCTVGENQSTREGARGRVKTIIGEDIRALLLAAAVNDPNKELWESFLDNKLALMSTRLEGSSDCSSEAVQKLVGDISPIVPLVRGTTADPNTANIARLILAVEDLNVKVASGPVTPEDCKVLLDVVRQNVK